VVATDGQVVVRHKQITDFARPQGARHAIAQVDYPIGAHVGQHDFERGQVSVNVSDDGDAHSITFLPPSSCLPSYLPSSVPLTVQIGRRWRLAGGGSTIR